MKLGCVGFGSLSFILRSRKVVERVKGSNSQQSFPKLFISVCKVSKAILFCSGLLFGSYHKQMTSSM